MGARETNVRSLPPPVGVISLFICTPTHSTEGGVERILESLTRHLPLLGFRVTFGLMKGARFHDPAKFRRAFPDVRGIEVDGTSGTAYGRRRALRRAILAADPDLILVARVFDAYPVCGELKREGHRLRLAVTIQAYEPEYLVDLARYAEFVDLCVTSGELIAEAVRRFTSMPSARVRSIPGGVAPPRRLRTRNDGPLRIGYVGRLEQVQKRVLDLPLLAAALDRRAVPYTCVVAGAGSAAARLREQLPGATFHGWLSHDNLYERIYPEIDVLIHFAEWEGITIAPREAMAHGVVPVVSRFTGQAMEAQFLDGVNSLTFGVGDVAGAADCIERLHRDRALLDHLSGAARESQTGIRSQDGAMRAWDEAFREALAGPRRVGSSLPAAPVDDGLLTSLGVPPWLAEGFRRVRGRRHSDPGSEWPHCSGFPSPELTRELEAFAAL